MQEQIKNAISWIKEQPIDGCITGSCLLDYFEGQDIDVFVYDEKSLNKILFAMKYEKMFQLIEDLEKWKFNDYIDKGKSSINKLGLITIKFKYNLSVDVNIIFRKTSTNIFAVLSNFDMNIVCKAYDIKTKKTLDLTDNPGKVADWNKWNPIFHEFDLWNVSRILRQLERCFKYYKRGYNTDLVIKKYIEIIREALKYESVFNSKDFDERVKNYKENLLIAEQICNLWLENHEITEEALEILKEKVKTI